jgi:hypothetical protein
LTSVRGRRTFYSEGEKRESFLSDSDLSRRCKMKRKLFGLLLVIALSALEGVPLAEAGPCPGCSLAPLRTSATYSGMGATCLAAKDAWRMQAIGEGQATCDSGELCSWTEFVTTACYWDSSCGAYRESGYIKYKCLPVGCL